MNTLVLSLILLAIALIFIVTHLHALNEKEVRTLADKRRNKAIKKYYTFHEGETTVNMEFKKKMNPRGAFYCVNENLSSFPSVAAGLLKYKKHEWVILGFEKNKTIELMWTNKGINKEAVTIHLATEQILTKCKDCDYSSVLIFHNHPNSDPHYQDCSSPSEQDIISAQTYSDILNNCGINLVEFVCERGAHYKYHFSESDIFLPAAEFAKKIHEINGTSKIHNLSLHTERVFSFIL